LQRFILAHAALVSVVLVAGCGSMPSVSTVVPNWPQSSGMTPEETRRVREQEMAIYTTTKSSAKSESTAQPAPAMPAPVVSNPPPAPSQPSANAAASGKRFEVAPELVAQVSPAPRAAVRDSGSASAPAKSSVTLPAGVASARYGDLIFISGQLPVDARGNATPSDARFEDQARLALENVRGVLEANKLSMANVVSMTVYLRDLEDVRAFDTLFASYFKGAQPARSVVEVARLPSNARIEISAVAGR
jgi:2-iminobutanoate/2-iminopropanoate deaminase